MLEIFQATTAEHRQDARELFWEYLQWGNLMLDREFGVVFDIQSMLEQDMLELAKFSPPAGRLLLASEQGQPAGIACLRKIKEGMGEVKRMYVRPAFRGRGIARALLERLIEAAREIGYARVRLDSARFMAAAHALYRSAGFQEIDPYPESEIPAEFQPNWIFMELTL
jgi:GNAT superfamily N-acetyltransferase